MIIQTEVELYVCIKPYWQFVELIAALPGISEISATIILAKIGVNMDVFDDAKHLCSWCGHSPSNNESAGKKKSIYAYLESRGYDSSLLVHNNDK